MRAKQGCIPTLRAAGLCERGLEPPFYPPFKKKLKQKHWKKKKKKTIWLELEVSAVCPVAHWGGLVDASLTHRRVLLLLRTSHQAPSIPTPTHPSSSSSSLSFSPVPAPCTHPPTHDPPLAETWHTLGAAAAGLPLFQLQRHAPPPALQPYQEAVTIMYVCVFVGSCVCHLSSQDATIFMPSQRLLNQIVRFISVDIVWFSDSSSEAACIWSSPFLSWNVLLFKYSSRAKSERASPLQRPLSLKPASVSLISSELLCRTLSHTSCYIFMNPTTAQSPNVTLKLG